MFLRLQRVRKVTLCKHNKAPGNGEPDTSNNPVALLTINGGTISGGLNTIKNDDGFAEGEKSYPLQTEIVKNGDERILKGYKRAVEKGDINALTGFDLYNQTAKEIEQAFIGQKTQSGIEVKMFSVHFIDRILGQVKDPHPGKRTGVTINEALTALKNGVVDKKRSNEKSVKITDGSAVVTINPKTGNLIQTNKDKK